MKLFLIHSFVSKELYAFCEVWQPSSNVALSSGSTFNAHHNNIDNHRKNKQLRIDIGKPNLIISFKYHFILASDLISESTRELLRPLTPLTAFIIFRSIWKVVWYEIKTRKSNSFSLAQRLPDNLNRIIDISFVARDKSRILSRFENKTFN